MHGDRGSTGYNPTLGVDPRSPCTSAPPSGLAGPKSASGDPLTRPKRPCGGRTGRRVGPTCTARPDLPANTPPVGRSGLAVHLGPRGAAPRAAAPSRDALLGVFTLEKALSKNTGGGGGPGGARPVGRGWDRKPRPVPFYPYPRRAPPTSSAGAAAAAVGLGGLFKSACVTSSARRAAPLAAVCKPGTPLER